MYSRSWIRETVKAVRLALLAVGFALFLMFGTRAMSQASSRRQVVGQPHLTPIVASGLALTSINMPQEQGAASLNPVRAVLAANSTAVSSPVTVASQAPHRTSGSMPVFPTQPPAFKQHTAGQPSKPPVHMQPPKAARHPEW